ncbi:MAG: cation:proton antiporter [Bernardetiaceae bacterium]
MLELAGLLVLGFFAQWLAWRIRVPAILPLIIVGLLVGPFSTLLTGGPKFVNGDHIFEGKLLFDVVSLSVGLILFEGGLTLHLKEIRKHGTVVRNLLFFGAVITMLLGGFFTMWIMDFGPRMSFLFASLIIVTGPTVIGPILRNVKPNANINTVLKWEGILIDPVGALIAILTYEFIVSGQSGNDFLIVMKDFALTVLSGTGVGVGMAFLTHYLLKKNLIPPYLRNVVILAIVIFSFVLSDLLHIESGLLAVTLMGIILNNIKTPHLQELEDFYQEIVIVLISFLFVLLSSRIEMSDIRIIFEHTIWGIPRSLILFAVVVFILRPLVVFASTYRSPLSLREKLFISWISPRGIVTAAIASIFALDLTQNTSIRLSFDEIFEASMLLPLTFLIILGTVVLQSLTATPIARFLGVLRTEASGVIFLSAAYPARFLAKWLQGQGVEVVMLDMSQTNTQAALSEGLTVIRGNALDESLQERVDFTRYGQFYGMTQNTEINTLAEKIFKKETGDNRVFRLISEQEMQLKDRDDMPQNFLLQGKIDFAGLTRLLESNPQIETKDLATRQEAEQFLKGLTPEQYPLFIHQKDKKRFVPLTLNNLTEEFGKNCALVYIQGKAKTDESAKI